ncbi:EAL domain-containing protein [Sulfidibacter corallicola]|uniref:EAL domain-containing protein n=1 Tax=Sulfidibacter corallicola TaxID=2818388 RepID=A0A8A4TKU5_SULCO|nr:EAL domain-containing protein [Sulfidibacter corallicola]QTD50576.1 EAL domain-containing protein [Sulfidibacter corallicola]
MADILIVEDEAITAMDLEHRLMNMGHRIVGICTRGEDAIYSAQKERPHLILMDIHLKGDIDGIQAAREIRMEQATAIVFLTAYCDAETLDKAKQVEPHGYVIKPYYDEALRSNIEVALYRNDIERRLKQHEALLSTVLQNIGDGVIAVDGELRVQFLNREAQNFLGEDALHKPLREVFRLDGVVEEEWQAHIGAVLSGRESAAFADELFLVSEGGRAMPVQIVLSPIAGGEENEVALIVTYRNLSRERELSMRLEHESTHDHVTGIYNREGFVREVFQRLDSDPDCALLFMDLDKFKIINEVHGHSAGDDLLRQLAAILRRALRPTDLVCRFSGDQFGVFLPSCAEEEAFSIAERLRETIQYREFFWEQTAYRVTASLGLAMVNGSERSLEHWMIRADEACHLAKEQGGNRVITADRSKTDYQDYHGRLRWYFRCLEALRDDRIALYRQDIVPLNAGDTPHCEILVRLIEGEHVYTPGQFLPAAELFGLMTDIDLKVLHLALPLIREELSRGEGPPAMVYSINLSGTSLSDNAVLEAIPNLVREHDLPFGSLCFEITETAAISNLSRVLGLIRECRELGCFFALDDFGSGLSSFAYLKSLPVDYLKIDGMFVKNLCEDRGNLSFVQAMNQVSHALGLKTVAEFVEDRATLERLRDIGVDFAQGYYFGKPRPFSSRFPRRKGEHHG